MDSSNLDGGRKWRRALGDERGDERGDALVAEVEADAYMARQLNMDPDLWLLEIEDREGRHLLEDILDGPMHFPSLIAISIFGVWARAIIPGWKTPTRRRTAMAR
jgi:hypothetical protein